MPNNPYQNLQYVAQIQSISRINNLNNKYINKQFIHIELHPIQSNKM